MSELLDLLLRQQLFGCALTIAAYAFARTLWERSGGSALLHPVFIATLIVALTVFITDLPYADYFRQAAPLNQALDVAIVLLAVPLYRQIAEIRKTSAAIVIALSIGSTIAIISALALPTAAGVGNEIIATLAPKSTTTPVAISIAERIGGITGLTAAIVISTGIFGAVFGPAILDKLSVDDDRARGFALGVASHAIGTARAIQMSEVAGAFASIGMILNAVLTVALAPISLKLLNQIL